MSCLELLVPACLTSPLDGTTLPSGPYHCTVPPGSVQDTNAPISTIAVTLAGLVRKVNGCGFSLTSLALVVVPKNGFNHNN